MSKFLSKWGLRGLVVIAIAGVAYGALSVMPFLRKPLVLLTSAEKSPCHGQYVRIDEQERVVGSDVDLGVAIAQRMGRRLQIQNVPFSQLLKRFSRGEGDFAIAMLSDTPERHQLFEISQPYDTQGAAFLCSAGKTMPTLITARDFRIAVKAGTTAEGVLRGRGIPARAYGTFRQAETALNLGEVDALFYDYPPLKTLADSSKGRYLVGPLETFEDYVVMVRKGERVLLDAANEEIAHRRHDEVRWYARRIYFAFILGPLSSVLLVVLSLVAYYFWCRCRRAPLSVGTLRVLSYLLIAFAFVLVVFVALSIASRYNGLLDESRSKARAEVEDCQLRLEHYLEPFRNLVFYGRDSLQWLSEHTAKVEEVNSLLARVSRDPCRLYPEFLGYYGVYDGQFVTSRSGEDGFSWIPTPDSDPLKCAWYRAAIEAKGELISLPPFWDTASRQLVLTYAISLQDGKSCICVDVRLSKLAKVFETEMPTIGNTYVFSSRGDVFVHPPDEPDGNWLELVDRPWVREFFLRASIAAAGLGEFMYRKPGGERVIAFVRRTREGFVVVRTFRLDLFEISYVWHFALECTAGAFLLALVCALSFLVWRGMSRLNNETVMTKNREIAAVHRAEEARSYFFSTVSHDIRTPLNAIVGYAELLRHGISDSKEHEQALEAIDSSGHMLLNLINDVLDLSKLESGKMEILPEPTDLMSLVAETAAVFSQGCSQKGIELIRDVEQIPPLLLDPHRIRQVMFNLLGNAVKFTERGQIVIRLRWETERLTLAVEDTGCGIAPEHLTRLMTPYTQVGGTGRHGGTGLGLAISKQLAERMGGSLTVVSRLGEGSTFTLTIPNVKSGVLVRVERASRLTRVPRRVLIVDDSPVNLKVLETLLRRIGVPEILQACDGRRALEVLDGTQVDLVLSDIWMPVMNGSEFVRELRTRERAGEKISPLPVYAVTADVEAVKDATSNGFSGILLKPLTIKALTDLFDRLS